MTYEAYQIGTYDGDCDDAVNLPIDPYPVNFLPYTEIVGQSGDGRPIEMGPPVCTWNFRRLTQEDYNFFLGYWALQFETPPKVIFIKTRVEEGNAFDLDFFTCVMWRPISTVEPGKYRTNVVIKFTQLVEVCR